MDVTLAAAEASADALLNAALSPTTVVNLPTAQAQARPSLSVVGQGPPQDDTPTDSILAKRLSQFVKIRDKITEMNKRHSEELAPLTDAKMKLEAALTELLAQAGTDSATVRGIATVYKGTESSATIADGEAFRAYVIDQQAWDLVDWRANKTGVKKFIGETRTIPPGVNFTQRQTVGVRKNTAAPT